MIMKENRKIYTVKEKIQETNDVVTLKLSCEGGIPKYLAGQFVTVYFDDTGNAEGKAYTISSEPSGATINITVKDIGQFSHKLCAMNIGDSFEASLPYGYFYSESETSTLVMIAGGIGITPFRSMIVDSLNKNQNRKLILFYSNKTVGDIIFKNEFDFLSEKYNNLEIKNYITQQEVSGKNFKQGRIKITNIIENTKDIENKDFLLCGSISFVRDFWKELKHGGIKEETIYTEAFF